MERKIMLGLFALMLSVLITACNGNTAMGPEDSDYLDVTYDRDGDGGGREGGTRQWDDGMMKWGTTGKYPTDFDGRYNPLVIPDMDRNQGTAPDRDRNEAAAPNNDADRRQAQPAPETPQQPAPNRGNQQDQAADMSEVERQVITLTNQQREQNGLPALQADTQLTDAAEKKSQDMVQNNYFSHTSPTYGSPFQMLDQFGIDYSVAAENIAAGQTSAEEVVNAWMKSEGHRRNILNKDITHIGVGAVQGDSRGYHWTQLFIKK
ncbi:CAP domain-containing protein [Bacillus marinisedimentorum]|uniref:CAP domain-containing protein n=1 Tax=Bacillus marinisedimentorum TaxID=1821260 RepID=UPI0008720E46|nr:CAP domain-containing protein [Bacillus marinisedimentorum]